MVKFLQWNINLVKKKKKLTCYEHDLQIKIKNSMFKLRGFELSFYINPASEVTKVSIFQRSNIIKLTRSHSIDREWIETKKLFRRMFNERYNACTNILFKASFHCGGSLRPVCSCLARCPCWPLLTVCRIDPGPYFS